MRVERRQFVVSTSNAKRVGQLLSALLCQTSGSAFQIHLPVVFVFIVVIVIIVVVIVVIAVDIAMTVAARLNVVFWINVVVVAFDSLLLMLLLFAFNGACRRRTATTTTTLNRTIATTTVNGSQLFTSNVWTLFYFICFVLFCLTIAKKNTSQAKIE